jgi:hypothetical protein
MAALPGYAASSLSLCVCVCVCVWRVASEAWRVTHHTTPTQVNITATNTGSAIAYNTDIRLHLAANVTFVNTSIASYAFELIPGARMRVCSHALSTGPASRVVSHLSSPLCNLRTERHDDAGHQDG